jgi:hypothetical protein
MALNNFFRFVSDFRSVAALIGKAALLAPFVGLLLNIGPPWPGKTSVPALTTLTQVFVLIYVFQFFGTLSRKRLEKRLRAFFFLLMGGFVIYIALYSFFVFETPTTDRVVKGFIIQDRIKGILGPTYTVEDALKGYEWDSEKIWEVWTVYTMQVSLLLAWILFFVALVGCIGVFVVLQQKAFPARASTAPPPAT